MQRLRSVFWLAFFGAAWVGFPASAPSSEAEGDDRSDFSDLISATDGTSDEMWEALSGSRFFLDTIGGADGHVEFFVMTARSGEAPGEYARWFLDGNEQHVAVCRLGVEGLPIVAQLDDVFVNLVPSRSVGYANAAPWAFVIDGNHLTEFADSSMNATGQGGRLRVDLIGFLTGIMDSETPQMQWDTETRTVTGRKRSGTEFQFRFRTPTDQRRFGTILSAAVFKDRGGQPFILRTVVLNASPIRIHIDDDLELLRKLDIPRQDELDLTHPALLLSKRRELAKARQFSRSIHALEPVDDRPVKHPEAALRCEELLVSLINYHAKVQVPKLAATSEAVSFSPFLDRMIAELETAYLAIEAAVAGASKPAIVDDPAIMWRGLELGIDPQVAKRLFNLVLVPLLASEQISMEDKIRLASTLGEFGPPPWAEVKRNGFVVIGDRLYAIELGPDERLLEAILHARWQWSASERDLAACRSILDDPTALDVAKWAAVDSLIRWGRLDEIAGPLLESWLNRQYSASRMTRHAAWKAMTRCADGRRLLLDRVERLDPLFQCQSEIAAILDKRAEATAALRRFDFMTESECDEIRTVCRPLYDE